MRSRCCSARPSSCWRPSRSARCGSTCRTSPRTTRTCSRRPSLVGLPDQQGGRRPPRPAGVHQPGPARAGAAHRADGRCTPAARQASALELELRAPGYRGTGRFAGYQPGGVVGVEAAVSPAPPRDADGVAVRAQHRPHERRARRHRRAGVGLAAGHRRSTASRAGDVDPAITFLGGPPQSMISRAGTILGRASDFTGGFVPLWLLWPLAIALRARRAAGAGLGALPLARARVRRRARDGASPRRAPPRGGWCS